MDRFWRWPTIDRPRSEHAATVGPNGDEATRSGCHHKSLPQWCVPAACGTLPFTRGSMTRNRGSDRPDF